MPNQDAARIALALAQAQGTHQDPAYEEGLQSPPEQQILQNLAKVASGYSAGALGGNIAGALAQNALPAIQNLGEAGAIFPEGAPLPRDKESLQELGTMLTDSQKNYLRNQNLAQWHAGMMDYPAVLKDKWALLTHTGGS